MMNFDPQYQVVIKQLRGADTGLSQTTDPQGHTSALHDLVIFVRLMKRNGYQSSQMVNSNYALLKKGEVEIEAKLVEVKQREEAKR